MVLIGIYFEKSEFELINYQRKHEGEQSCVMYLYYN